MPLSDGCFLPILWIPPRPAVGAWGAFSAQLKSALAPAPPTGSYLCLVVDLSRAVSETDMRPSRLAVLLQLLPAYVRAYFDENPLSQLALVVTRNGPPRPFFCPGALGNVRGGEHALTPPAPFLLLPILCQARPSA